jgi:hypothetical protein
MESTWAQFLQEYGGWGVAVMVMLWHAYKDRQWTAAQAKNLNSYVAILKETNLLFQQMADSLDEFRQIIRDCQNRGNR